MTVSSFKVFLQVCIFLLMTPPFQLCMRAKLLQNNSLLLTEQQRCFPCTLSSIKYGLEIYTDYIDPKLRTIQWERYNYMPSSARGAFLFRVRIITMHLIQVMEDIFIRCIAIGLKSQLLLSEKRFFSAFTSSGELNKLSKVSLT